MRWIGGARRGLEAFAVRDLALLPSVALAVIMILSIVDVVGRYFFNAPTPAAAELIGLGMAIVVFGGVPLATARRDHIVVDLVLDNLPHGLRRILERFADVVTAFVLAVGALLLGRYAAQLGSFNELSMILKMPVAPIAWAVAAFLAVAAVLALSNAIGSGKRA